ncbi:ATP-binding cassette domain-containing protein [Rhodopirellula sp. MGV]|uniref:ATP-binding cassette domain-containing protein n=1 Tax=Rhodopirellula sp. MGV TaxID=2023130 RepID=UPI000B96854D|nr:ATP-binding cassette domain-containing protein [Rhodopirellula sp. MGV]OYP29882.1 ABC transporter ATP-binding protein [Rhodopirellula sp. MGV]PNY33764.1 ABC transporter ATP-binding protein [Rhodopirellula baltica]
MIHVQQLTKRYEDLQRGRFTAVDGISFTAKRGEIFGLLGPNGAGKTTVLRILSTVLEPSEGIVTVAGYDVVRDPAEVRRSIGFVSNNTAIYDRMTAWEMVEYFGRLHGMRRDELRDRMEELFSQLRMDDFRDVPGGKMSTGMKQKVSIARAMIHDPPVLIFDEATLGLDVLVARNLLAVIRSLRDAGKCLIFSTHIMSEVERLCDKIAIMYRGKILDTGTLDELRQRHQEDDFEELFFGLLSQHERENGRVSDTAVERCEGDVLA